MPQVSQGTSLAPADGDYLPPRPGRAVEEPPQTYPVEWVSVGNSLAPAEGQHEPSPLIGSPMGRSQTGAASDPGTVQVAFSNGEVVIPSPGHISGLPVEWASDAMANSQPGFTYRPTLFSRIREPELIYHVGSARYAKPGPESMGAADLYRPAPGLPVGETRPQIVPPGSAGMAGFRGNTVTAKLAKRFMGPRGLREPGKFSKMIRRSPGRKHGA